MKTFKMLLPAVATFAAAATFAETLVFAPGNGVTTNVSERLPAGVDVQANTGSSGGGIVNLLDSVKGPIGTATVKCGTLSADTIRRASMLNGMANLVLGNGTFRYTGSKPATTDMDILLDTVASNDAAVVWCDGDLKTTGTFDANNGAMIKTGPGTFTIATAARDGKQLFSHSRQGNHYNWIMNMKENGDSPTQTYGNLTVREGHLVIDTADSVTNVLGCHAEEWCDTLSYVLCGCRSGATGAGSEPYGHIDIKGGTVLLNGIILVGFYNGTSATRPDADSGSSFNIYGGKVKCWSGDATGSRIKVGYATSYDDRPGLPSFNVYHGTVEPFYTQVAINRGARGRVLVCGSTAVLGGYGIYGAHDAGGTSSDDEYMPQAEVHVCSNGLIAVSMIQPCRSGYCDFTIRVTDGGTLRRAQAIAPNANYATSPMKLVLDGGNLLLWGANYTIVPDSFKTRLGTKISTIDASNAGTYTLGSEVVTDTDLVPSGSSDGGLRITGSSSATLAFTGGMSISGPLVINDGVTVKFAADAATGAVTAEKNDMSLAFGWTGSRFARLTAAGWDVPGIARITLDGAWTAGTYDLVSLPGNAEIDAAKFVLKTASDTTGAYFATRTEDGRTILSVTLAARSVASHAWTNAAGGTWGDGANWGDGTGSSPSGSSARAAFATAADAQGTAVTLADGVTVGGMTFSASPGYTLSGATLTLDNAGSPAAVAVTSGADEIAAPVAIAGETQLNAASGATLDVSGVVSGAWPLTVNAAGGTGTVRFSGVNTFTASPYVKAGTLHVDSIANAGTASAAGAGSSVKVGTATFEFDGTGATDRSFEMAATSSNTKAALAATAGSTLTVNGAVKVTGNTIFAKSGAGTVALNGVGGYSLPCNVAVDAGTLAFGSDVFVSQANSVTVASGAALALNSGAALHTRILTGTGTVLWNGGRWYPSFGTSGNATFGVGNNRIGSVGATIDLSDMVDQDLALGGSWTTADGVTTDGGITISSPHPATDNWLMSVSFPAIATYGFNGPVTLASGGVAKTTGAALAGNSVVVQANAAIAAAMSGSAAEEATVKNITLADGASVFNYTSGAGVCATLRATDSLSVAGTVYVALCKGTGIPNLENAAGTYAILRGPKGTLDASKFAMSPRYKKSNGTFTLDTSNENYDEVRLALVSATLFNSSTERDFRRDFVWTAGNGLWRDAANWDRGFAPEDLGTSRGRVIFPSTVANGTVVTLDGTRMLEVLETSAPGEIWFKGGTIYPIGSGEHPFVKTTAGTVHFENLYGDEWRSTFIDSAAGSTQVVDGVMYLTTARPLQYYVNRLSRPDGGMLLLEGIVNAKLGVYSGTLAGHPDSFASGYPITIDNCTLSLLSSGEMPSKVASSEESGFTNGMNLHIADGEEVLFSDDVSCTGPFVKTGGGTAYLGGSGSVRLGTANRGNADSAYRTAATEIPANGDLPADGLGVFSLAAGKLVLGLDDRQQITVNGRLDIGQNIADFDANGKVLDSELEILGGTVTVVGDINIGRGAGAYRLYRDCGEKKRNVTLTMRGGNLSFNGMYMAHDSQQYYNGTATFNLYGGTVTSKGGYVNLACTRVAHTEYGRAKSVVNIYGGMFTNTMNTLSTYPGGNALLDINMFGGDFAWTAPFKIDGGNGTDIVNFNLHGGTFTAPYITRMYGGSLINFYFNGGVYRPTQDEASFRMNETYGWTSIIVSTNGAALDIPGANTFTLNQAFTHDPVLSTELDGGIRKRGTGTLLMSVANTFTGPCVAEAGVMKPQVREAIPGGIVLAGGTFDCNDMSFTVPYLNGAGGEAVNGTVEVAGTMTPLDATMTNVPYATVANLAFGENAVVSCPLMQDNENFSAPYFRVTESCTGVIMLDFGLANDVMLATGTRVKVAEYTSGVTSFPAVKGMNFGISRRRHIGREMETDSVTGVTSVYAVLNPAGVAISFR